MSLIDLSSKRIALSDGLWIEARNQLTSGERRRTNSTALKGQTYTKDGGGATITDTDALAMVAYHRAFKYITAWNVHEDDGQPWPLTLDGLQGLPAYLFDEIDEALTAHIEASEEAAKNARSARSIN